MLAPVPACLALRAPTGIAVAALLLPAGLLSGCGGDSTDNAQSSTSATTSATPTPTPSTSAAPEVPKAPKDTAAARAAYVRHVVDAWGYALRTNDASVVTDLSQKKQPCKGCSQFKAALAQRTKQGWHVDFPGATVQKVVVKPVPGGHAKGHAPKAYSGHAVVDIPASRSYFDDGSFRNVNDAHSNAPFDVVMAYSNGKYVLLEFQVG